jgi:CBS domain-containing protein
MDTTLRDVLRHKDRNRDLLWVPPEASVSAAVHVMAESGVGSVLVMEEGRIQGLFTERDLMCRVVHRGLSVERTLIGEVMTREVITVSPEMTVGEAMSLCTGRRVRHLPVYEGDRLLGIVSIGDLTKNVVRDQQHTIEDLISYINGGIPA